MFNKQTITPWWKQSWPWFLISLPAIAVVGCSITIWLAFSLHPDAPIRDGVVKHGLIVEQVAK
jgi:hypothetical protein